MVESWNNIIILTTHSTSVACPPLPYTCRTIGAWTASHVVWTATQIRRHSAFNISIPFCYFFIYHWKSINAILYTLLALPDMYGRQYRVVMFYLSSAVESCMHAVWKSAAYAVSLVFLQLYTSWKHIAFEAVVVIVFFYWCLKRIQADAV